MNKTPRLSIRTPLAAAAAIVTALAVSARRACQDQENRSDSPPKSSLKSADANCEIASLYSDYAKLDPLLNDKFSREPELQTSMGALIAEAEKIRSKMVTLFTDLHLVEAALQGSSAIAPARRAAALEDKARIREEIIQHATRFNALAFCMLRDDTSCGAHVTEQVRLKLRQDCP